MVLWYILEAVASCLEDEVAENDCLDTAADEEAAICCRDMADASCLVEETVLVLANIS